MLKRIHFLFIILLISFLSPCQEIDYFPGSIKPGFAKTSLDRVVLIDFAEKYLGTPYRSAGSAPNIGFDCSGFVYFVFKNFQIDVPRSSVGYQFLGNALKPSEYQIGDVLIFYGYKDRASIGHVGIICEANGEKSRFIHASSGNAHAVTVSNLDSDLYRARFYKCIDVIDP